MVDFTYYIIQLNGNITGICPISFPCVVSDWSWSVCDNNLCYGDTGQVVSFQQFNIADTIKVCLTTIGDINGITFTCTQCDSVIFGPNGWMFMNVRPTSINEVQFGTINDDNKMYDMLGRELFYIPTGIMYIQNRKIYIRK